LNTAATLDDKNPYNYFDLSRLYLKSANLKMALEKIDQAIALENRRSFLQHKAKLLLKLGKTEEAGKTFDEIWKSWQSAYNKLKRLAIREGIEISEINSL